MSVDQEFDHQFSSQPTIRPFRGLRPVKNIFGGNPHLDPGTEKKRRTAARRTGGPTAAAQQLLSVSQHDCPWQIYQDPETGKPQIERRYDPASEPLTQKGED